MSPLSYFGRRRCGKNARYLYALDVYKRQVLDFLDRHLPEQFRPLVEKARELLPVPELQQPEQEQERGHTWGGMEL